MSAAPISLDPPAHKADDATYALALRRYQELAAEMQRVMGEMSRHRRGTPEYRTWSGMMTRCRNPRHRAWKNYGGRGIQVCERWQTFSLFYRDMGNRPDGMTLDRIDVNGDYEPENCRWAGKEVQARNKRNNSFAAYLGKRMTLMEWSRELHVPSSLLYSRYARGMRDEALFRNTGR